MNAATEPSTASAQPRLPMTLQATSQVVRDPYRLWLWLQLPLWLIAFGLVWQWGAQWFDRPLTTIEVDGEFVQLDAAELEQQLWQRLALSETVWPERGSRRGASYASQDLNEFKQLLEQQAWVNEVEIRRSWPDRLQVRVREERPVARWGEQGLVNEQGRIFMPAGLFSESRQAQFGSLPQLSGPQSQSLKVMAHYRDFNQILRPLGVKLAGLQMEARGAWTLLLDNDIRLIVGRGQAIDKLHRFSRVYGTVLKRYAERIEQVDVRYTNGLAVTWREPPVRQTPN